MRSLRCLLIGIVALQSWAAVAQMGINGRLDDWAEIPVLYAHDQDYGADSPLGRVARLKAAADEQQLFALIEFEAARPFQDPARPERLRSGVWDDMTYLELDTNGDAKWDYRTQMSTGKRIGMNNLAVLQADPEGHARGRFLYPEGHKNYFPLGPRAWFAPDARAVEMRLPRAALALESGLTIGLRVHLRYRDTLRGSGAWVTEYYPPSGQWVPFTFGPPLPRGSRAVLTEGKVMLPLSITPEGVEVADANLMDNEDVAARPLAQPWKVPSLVENAQKLPMRKASNAREAEVESRAAYGDRVDAPRTPAGATIQPLPSDSTAFAMAPPADDPAAIPPDEQRPRSIPLAAEPTVTPSPVPTLTPTPITTATPTVTPLPTITVTPNPEPTATPWPTPTMTPDPNPTPTPTPTPNPTMSPAPSPRPVEPQARMLVGPADAPLGQEPVVVDGNVQDWRRADFTNAISPQLMAQASASVAKLERISVATSPGYLYVRLDYVEPRRPGRNGAAGAEVLEQAGSLLRLDVDNNGDPDYEVRLTGSDGTPQGAELVNRADARLLTPVADASQPGMALALSPDGKSVEIRLPRAALGLSGPGKVRLQAVARYQLATTGKWHHMAYPGPHSWFACALR